jgi:small subunit ribosomal protein S8e
MVLESLRSQPRPQRRVRTPRLKKKKRSEKSPKPELTKDKKDRVIDGKVQEQFGQQRLYACISSRPGQSGRADGYILEGKETRIFTPRKLNLQERNDFRM